MRDHPYPSLAPHGGRIELNTCQIAGQISGGIFNYYCFEGLKKKNNRDLHITSHRFDEPRAVELVRSSEIVVAVHAMKIMASLNAAGIGCRINR